MAQPMTSIKISGKTGSSEIFIGESISNFWEYLPKGKTIVITDGRVNELYGKLWQEFPSIVIGQGESNKTIATLTLIIHQLLELNADRKTFILGIGGGIVCDVAGFAASVFMRGLKFGFISTTLLSQVDASVGGKNGVNFEGYKNIVGVFNQPEFVLCDPSVLKTLDRSEISNGLAEIVKHALIADAGMFDFLEKNISSLLSLDEDVINHVVTRSVEVKSAIVNLDEKEQGERRKLNFGHTFGHAIEKVAKISHGNAVSLGMVIAARYSHERGKLNKSDLDRIINLLKKLELPVVIDFDYDQILEALLKDKKREDNNIYFVSLKKIGQAVVEELPIDIVRKISI
jgi:3-dehydroquinate synthase